MGMLLKDRTVFITGATSGFGLELAKLCVAQGAKVVITGRREDRLKSLAAELKGASVHMLCFDVRDKAAVEKAIAALPAAFAKVDILINNAGLALDLSSFENVKMADAEQMVETNILGLMYCTHVLLPGMVEHAKDSKTGGHIVNIGSTAGNYPYPGGNVYGATKAFVKQFSLNLRSDLYGKNVRVTNIEPGMAETEFSLVRFGGDKQKSDSVYKGMEPLSAQDVAETILWCICRPRHVNINRVELMPTEQACGPFVVSRKG
jgi:3-hydroxy acid dehydrogenase / malonic semialdehyde reductase